MELNSQIYSALSSPVRTQILKLLIKKKNQSIMDINNLLPEYNYRSIWQHIQTLESANLIKTTKEEHSTGKKVVLDLTDLARKIVKLGIIASLTPEQIDKSK